MRLTGLPLRHCITMPRVRMYDWLLTVHIQYLSVVNRWSSQINVSLLRILLPIMENNGRQNGKDERDVQCTLCSAPPSTHPLGKLVADEIKDTQEGKSGIQNMFRSARYVFQDGFLCRFCPFTEEWFDFLLILRQSRWFCVYIGIRW